MIDLGIVRPGSTLYIPFDSFAAATGAPSAVTNYAVGDILIYKDGNSTARASTTGFTATTSFSSVTGINLIVIDLSSDATADFFKAGSKYFVVVSPITIDGQTVAFAAATFEIGYPSAILNTSIATLASQTSFTLTAGPAEDDALNGMWAIAHDKASAVQHTWVQILDYTGSTKTVTLAATPAATFTMAAIDNFSVIGVMPLQPVATGRQLDVTAANKVNGVVLVDTLTTYTGNTVQTGDSFVRIGAAGASLSAIPWNAAWDAEVQSEVADEIVLNNLDHLCKVAVADAQAMAEVVDNTIIGNILSKSSSTTTYDPTTDSLEALRDNTGTAGAGLTAADDAVITVLGVAGAGLTGIPWNSAWDADVESEVSDALIANNLDHLCKTAVADNQAMAEVVDGTIIGNILSKSASTTSYDPTTDSLEALRDNTGTAGAGLTAIDLPNQTMDIIGNITGNLSGSVGSVTGAVGSVTGAVGSVTGNVGGTINGLTAVALKDFFDTDSTTNYGAAVAGSVVKEIADNAGGTSLTEAGIAAAVWDLDATTHQTQGTFGQAIGDPVADTNTIFKAVVTDATGATVGVDVVDLKTQIGAAGAGLTAIDLPDQTMNITGNLSGSVGSVTGAVGSVTGAVGSVAAGGITAASFAANAINAAKLDPDVTTELQAGLATAAALATVDGVVDSILTDTGNIINDIAALPTGVENADALLARNVAGGSSTGRTVKQALFPTRNKTEISGGTLTVYEPDDTTPSWDATVTTAAGNPITGVDPA